ncbi:MAG TPA: cytochrome C oxidase subunit IV family protein [Steroidobacteraceae bacterium]|nr:cytochrome C oxidase subunit IV family protein [Steroidobacteraceae bacterium]
MTGQAGKTAEQARLAAEERRDLHAYVWGVTLALLLTVVPFALVHEGHASRFALWVVIGTFGIVQMIVHFRCFLHITLSHKREDLQLILFSALILIILIGGTVWIMGSLALRMALPLRT